jgi:hypothetical protein
VAAAGFSVKWALCPGPDPQENMHSEISSMLTVLQVPEMALARAFPADNRSNAMTAKSGKYHARFVFRILSNLYCLSRNRSFLSKPMFSTAKALLAKK